MDLALVAFALTMVASSARIIIYFERLQRISNSTHDLVGEIRDQISGLREDLRSHERL